MQVARNQNGARIKKSGKMEKEVCNAWINERNVLETELAGAHVDFKTPPQLPGRSSIIFAKIGYLLSLHWPLGQWIALVWTILR